MILVFDVGNTETTIGLFTAEMLRGHWRIITSVPRTSDEYGILIGSLLQRGGYEMDRIDGVAIGSVVPAVTAPLLEACSTYLPVSSAIVVDAQAGLPIKLDVDEPLTVGADRLINTLAASRMFGRDCIVVDLGTATTFDCITAEGTFIGGVIAPGVQTSAETLTRRTSKLPATDLEVPQRAIGRRTEDCIRSGVMFGAADSIDGMVRRIKAEWPHRETPLVVATGGYAEVFGKLCREFDRVEPHLTLQGLQMAHALLSAAPADDLNQARRAPKSRSR
ncbi:MAG TPA: type III pantothenate kinase [Gemmatimonadaceae bacterium]|nr:type III pantothenate kinase [Gemmatimonadaceae bacterium]